MYKHIKCNIKSENKMKRENIDSFGEYGSYLFELVGQFWRRCVNIFVLKVVICYYGNTALFRQKKRLIIDYINHRNVEGKCLWSAVDSDWLNDLKMVADDGMSKE